LLQAIDIRRYAARMSEDVLAHIRERIELARRLARSTTDREVAGLLEVMADEGEADLRKLEQERSADCGDKPRD
jgi:hypothetical protein